MKETFLKEPDPHVNAEFSTIVEILRWRAVHQPDQKAYAFFTYGEEENSLTYATLDRKARAIGAMLQKLGATGERILLLYPPELDYIAAFFGCLYAGAIAVPAYPPNSNRSIGRIQSIVADAQARFVLTTSQMLPKIERSLPLVPDLQVLQWIVTDRESREKDETLWQMPQITESTIAFLQYTSGSTAAPKGVMISHRNLLSNHRMIQSTMDHSAEFPFVSWLPLFHDMGLIKMLQALYIGSPCILIPSSAFIQSPIRWLQTISLYQASMSAAPNFAYELSVEKILPAQRDALDLQHWKAAFCGAEPIRYQTLTKFAHYFAPCGFRSKSFRPVYGMAEATVFVTGHPHSRPPLALRLKKESLEQNQVLLTTEIDERSYEYTSCGRPELDARVIIVDPETCTLSAPKTIGEIWIAGSHVAQGYWNRFEETEETFHAYLQNTGEGPFLRTGDLGFLMDENLFVTGRRKDLLIIQGRNHYPQDIEQTVECSHVALRPQSGAAFSVEVDSEEQLILVQEVQREYRDQEELKAICRSVRRAVAEEHDIQVYDLVLIKYGSIPKTSSGKIQRRACRQNFLDGELKVMCQWSHTLQRKTV